MFSQHPHILNLQREAMEQEQAITNLALAFPIPLPEVRARFVRWRAKQPYDWRTCYRLILTGKTDWLEDHANT